MFSNFFIERPIFAWVLALLITLGGVLAISSLGIESYPPIAPPQVAIAAVYPGADAETVEHTVTQVIEQQLSGIDHLMYFSSTSNALGLVIRAIFVHSTETRPASSVLKSTLPWVIP